MDPDTTFKPGNVVRTVRAGNKTRANYVIDRVLDGGMVAGGVAFQSVEAHREYSGRDGQYMLLRSDGATVLRSYS